MWILLRQKLPTAVSPPKMAILWSVPWPHHEYAVRQATLEHDDIRKRAILKRRKGKKSDDEEVELLPPDQLMVVNQMGCEPNWNGARKIQFDGESLRVFPHEFTPVPSERLRFYIDEGVYELIPEGAASEAVIEDLMEGDKRVLWEHALVDGCTDAQAKMVALGIDITLPDVEVPPVGWYRCRPEYAAHFCYEDEMEETRAHA
jgi:hypothetical protein